MTDPFRRELEGLPEQFAWSPRPEGRVRPPAVLVGLGGSGLAAELAAARVDGVAPPPVLREEGLPSDVPPGTTVVCVSCSGTTAEVLRTWEEAGERGLPRAAVASGGPLLERAQAAEAPHCALPGGPAPRASVGYLVQAVLALLHAPAPPDDTAAHLRAVAARWSRDAGEDLVHRLEGGVAVLLAAEGARTAARRWAADLAENAKRPALVWELPEAAHNALMVFAEEAKPAIPLVPVALGAPRDPGRRRSWDALRDLLSERGSPAWTVAEPHADPWVETLGLILAGGWCSVRLAERIGVPAASLSLMDRLKARRGGA